MNRAEILKMKTFKDKHGNLFSSFILYVPFTTSNEKWTFEEFFYYIVSFSWDTCNECAKKTKTN